MDVTVPPIVETQLTGFVGSASVIRGRVKYQVSLTQGQAPTCTVDGRVVPATHNATMLRLVTNARKFFNC